MSFNLNYIVNVKTIKFILNKKEVILELKKNIFINVVHLIQYTVFKLF